LAGSRVVVDDVALTDGSLHAPVAQPDLAATDEDTPVTVTVLANDVVSSPLDPKSVTVTTGPQHGSVTVDPATGQITYTPATNFRGTDTFAYRVRDIDGLRSNEAAVVVTVSPVPDAPTLTVQSAAGNQDTAIPLQITAALTDPAEQLTIDVADLPPGARLS